MYPQTRGEMRDSIRRKLGIVPPIDTALKDAVPGDAPVSQANPSNALINQAIDQAISRVNREAAVFGNQTTIPIANTAQTAKGPYVIDVLNIGRVNSVRRLTWLQTGSTTRRVLAAASFAQWQRENQDVYNRSVGTPAEYVMEAYKLYVLPAPSVAGTFYLQAGVGLQTPAADNDTIGQLPSDYYDVVSNVAVAELCGLKASDKEMQERLKFYGPMAMEGVNQIAVWHARQMEEYQPSIGYDSPRIGRGRRR